VEIIVLGPALKGVGGVANYYSNLNLHSDNKIVYFEVNSINNQNALSKVIRLIFNYFLFIKLISKKSVKIVHVNPSLDFNSFWRDSLFIFLGLLFSKKTLVFFRGWEDSFERKILKNSFLNLIFKKSYLKADTFIVLGEIFKNKLLKMGARPNMKFYIETTVADSRFLNDFDIDNKINSFDEDVKILFISRIEKEKGIYIALDAFNKFIKNNPSLNVKLTVAGSGKELQSAEDYCSNNQIERVDFLGHVKGDQKGTLLKESHIMLFPTYYGEGLPNSILEGMLYGMPIISRFNAGIPDVVKNNVNGFLTESLNSDEFEKYLEMIILDKEKYKIIANYNHIYALERFTSDKVRDRLLAIYKDLNII
jgi:glycosyltransferase involved in cell wall biosynthesis